MFDEQPDGDPHGECAAEIHRLTALLAAKQEELDKMREALKRARHTLSEAVYERATDSDMLREVRRIDATLIPIQGEK